MDNFVGVGGELDGGESSSVFTATGDLERLRLDSLTGDLFRAGNRLSLLDFSDFAVLFACVLFRGVGLIVSSAKAKSISSVGVMSSPPFTLHEMEQYRLLSL